MNMNYNEKIKKIKEDRILLLNKIKENIEKNNFELSQKINIDTLSSAIEFDEKNSKEYSSILKAKQLIFELTQQIATTNNVEEIINLRKKINYYINKIKKELNKRENNQQILEDLYDKVAYLRNDISSYLRFLKRENTILEIENLITNNKHLDIEELDRLKKLITNEHKYNKRNLKKLAEGNYYVKKQKKEKQENENIVENIEEHTKNEDAKKDEIKHEPIITNIKQNMLNNICEKGNDDGSLEENYIDMRINYYNNQYSLAQLFDYNGDFFKRIINCFRNIPRYRWNKKMIKLAERDYNIYYHGQDLNGYITYLKRKNSIAIALSAIFKSSHLSKKEIECLYNHDKCKEWILEFFLNQNNKNLVRVNGNN